MVYIHIPVWISQQIKHTVQKYICKLKNVEADVDNYNNPKNSKKFKDKKNSVVQPTCHTQLVHRVVCVYQCMSESQNVLPSTGDNLYFRKGFKVYCNVSDNLHYFVLRLPRITKSH